MIPNWLLPIHTFCFGSLPLSRFWCWIPAPFANLGSCRESRDLASFPWRLVLSVFVAFCEGFCGAAELGWFDPERCWFLCWSGWWFGIFFYFSIYWEESSQLTHIFQRGSYTTNQWFMVMYMWLTMIFTRKNGTLGDFAARFDQHFFVLYDPKSEESPPQKIYMDQKSPFSHGFPIVSHT